MTARSAIDDGLEWLSAVIERLHNDPALIATEFGEPERYATLLLLDAIHQDIRSELRRGSKNRLAIGQRPFRREPAKSVTLQAHENATFSHVVGHAAVAGVLGLAASVRLVPDRVGLLTKLLTSKIGVAADETLALANAIPIGIELDGKRSHCQSVMPGVLWLPNGIVAGQLQAIVDTLSHRKAGQNGRIHTVFAPEGFKSAVASQLGLSLATEGVALDVLSAVQQFVACEDHSELFEHTRKLERVGLFVGFGTDPLRIESMGCRSRATHLLTNRSPQSLHGGFAWLEWNTRTALDRIAPRTIVVREDTASVGVALDGTMSRIRAWVSGLAQSMRHGTDDEDLW